MNLHFETRGQGSPLLILHGLFGSLDNWHSIAGKLANSFQVFSLDLRNHGRSPHSDEMSYQSMAEDISEFIASQRLQQVALLGHSLGGKVAMQFSLVHPDKVAALIVADMSPRAYPPRHNDIFDALFSLDLSSLHSRKQMEEALAPAIPELPLRQFLLKNVKRDAGGAFMWRFNLSSLQANYSRLNEPITSKQAFNKSTLFIRGGESDYVTDADLPAIHQLFPRAKIITLPRAGHWLHVQAADEFISQVTAFLSAESSIH